jgi:phosphotransferase system enzyme I (PtsI)
MFPMVATMDDVQDARRAVAAAAAALSAEGIEHRPDPPLGIMIEVPSAALLIERLIRAVDFVSIGTNDLAQYTLAADRTNPATANRYDAFDPAVQRLIAMVAEASHAAGKPVAVCGELAGDPEAIPTLIALGIHELSMTPSRIPAAKETIRG